VDVAVARPETARSVSPPDAGPRGPLVTPPTAAPMDYALIQGYLDDVRAATRADEVVFWTSGAGPTDLEIGWWSTGHGLEPEFSRAGNRLALAQWAAQERIVQTDSAERVHFAVAPVVGSYDVLGAVSVASGSGLKLSRNDLRDSLDRYARHLAGLHELLITRDQYSRSSQQTSALLTAAQRFTTQRALQPLSESIAQAAFEMTGGRAMALVRWNSDIHRGEIVYATTDARVAGSVEVVEDSQVGHSCSEDMPLILEDARPLKKYIAIYTPEESIRELGSLAIIPLHGTDKDVVGAIVIEGSAPRDIRAEDGKNLRLLSVLAGASLETVWEIQEITRRATIDPLTGLFNRGYFETLLRHMITETDRFGGTSALIMVDLDHFKKVNDTYGHLAGDAVLKTIAEVLTRRVRAVDSCARYGGEELALLLPRTDVEGAAELAERLREAVVANWKGTKLEVTISCGVAAYPRCARTAEDLIAAADQALYAAKAAGRNVVKTASVLPAPAST
jgi:diguanylate cyclase (GGDEF)-like protein